MNADQRFVIDFNNHNTDKVWGWTEDGPVYVISIETMALRYECGVPSLCTQAHYGDERRIYNAGEIKF